MVVNKSPISIVDIPASDFGDEAGNRDNSMNPLILGQCLARFTDIRVPLYPKQNLEEFCNWIRFIVSYISIKWFVILNT